MAADLRALIQDHKAKASEKALVEQPLTLDQTLADELEDLEARRKEIERRYAAKRAALANEDEDSARWCDASTDQLDAGERTELDELAQQVEAVKAAGSESTVVMVFVPPRDRRVDELQHRAVRQVAAADAANEDTAGADDLFLADLLAESFRGVRQSDGSLDTSVPWSEWIEAQYDNGAYMLSSGWISVTAVKVLATVRRFNATPFSSASSAKIPKP